MKKGPVLATAIIAGIHTFTDGHTEHIRAVRYNGSEEDERAYSFLPPSECLPSGLCARSLVLGPDPCGQLQVFI